MDNINNKVQVKSQNTMKNISVHYTTDFIAQSLAKDWAVKMDSLVDNTDYSSKYYATKSKLNKTETDNMLAEAREQASIAKLCVKKAYTAINQKLAPATDEFLGGIKVGESLYISEDGVLNTDAEHLDLYEKNDINAMLSEKLDSSDLPTNLSSFNNDIPFATLSSLNNLNTQVVKKTDIATADSLGIVKPDNNTIIVNADGELSSPVTIDKITQFNAARTGYASEDKDILNWIQEMAHSTFDRSKFTVVGSPSITDDGIILPNWNISNCAKNTIVGNGSTNYEIHYRLLTNKGNFTSGSSFTQPLYLTNIGSTDWILEIFTESGQVLKAFRAGFEYVPMFDNPASVLPYTDYIDIVIKNNGVSFTISTYKDDGTLLKTITSPTSGSELPIETLTYKTANNDYFTTGTPLYSIDLRMYKVKVDGVEVFSGNKTGINTIKPDDYTVVGTPTISADGVVSGFSESNYITSSSILLKSTKWDIECLFKSDGIQATSNRIVEGTSSLSLIISASSNRLAWSFGSLVVTRTTNYVVDNTYHILKLSYNSGTFNLYIDGSLIDTYSATIEDNITTTIYFGKSSTTANRCLDGSIDLNAFKIYVDGNLVYQPCLKIPYTESKTGSKIVQSVYRDRVNDMYEQFGYAPYYTLSDTDFTLPQGELYGLIEKRARDIAHPIGEPFYRLTDEIFEDEVRLEGAEVDKGLYLAIEQKLASYCSAGSDSTKIVLPNFINRVPWGAINQGCIEAGLPNITGSFGSYYNATASGAFNLDSSVNIGRFPNGEGGGNNNNYSLDASRSNSIYGNSTTVQPPAFKVRWLARYK